MARPTDLTPDCQAKVCEALRAGNTRRASALYAGISEQTFYEWVARGRGTNGRETTPLHASFLEAVEKAEAEAEVQAVAIVKLAAQTQWTAGAWWLERKRPADWARAERTFVERGDEDGGKVARSDVIDLTPEQIAARWKDLT